MSAGRPLVDVTDIGKIWRDGRRRIDISIDRLRLHGGEIKVLAGPSGAGKSTALDLLALTLRPEPRGTLRLLAPEGEIDARPLLEAGDEDRLSRLRATLFSYVVQTSDLIQFLTLAENCRLQQRICGRGDAARTRELARTLGVDALLGSYPAELSVGQRQRAAILRATCCAPRVLLADEPTAAQDPALKDRVIEVLAEVAREGTAVLIVTHDIGLVDRHGLGRVGVSSHEEDGDWHTRFSDAELAVRA